jgi:hypothetical protein
LLEVFGTLKRLMTSKEAKITPQITHFEQKKSLADDIRLIVKF